MNCSKTRRLLSAYCDAELPAERRAAVRRHLQGCEDCRALVDGFKHLAVLTAKWTDLQAPASLWHALAPKLTAVCETVAAATGSGDARRAQSGGVGRPAPSAIAPSAAASPRRTFKPFLEGLEDRYPLSGLFCTAGTALAPDRFASAVAVQHADRDWSASFNSAAEFTGWGSLAGVGLP